MVWSGKRYYSKPLDRFPAIEWVSYNWIAILCNSYDAHPTAVFEVDVFHLCFLTSFYRYIHGRLLQQDKQQKKCLLHVHKSRVPLDLFEFVLCARVSFHVNRSFAWLCILLYLNCAAIIHFFMPIIIWWWFIIGWYPFEDTLAPVLINTFPVHHIDRGRKESESLSNPL